MHHFLATQKTHFRFAKILVQRLKEDVFSRQSTRLIVMNELYLECVKPKMVRRIKKIQVTLMSQPWFLKETRQHITFTPRDNVIGITPISSCINPAINNKDIAEEVSNSDYSGGCRKSGAKSDEDP